jgi:very-short-patch-repair endonuclease
MEGEQSIPVKSIVIGQSVSNETKELRRELTPAEKTLWKELKTNKLNGLHFRRQQIIDKFIQEFDAEREAYLIARGFRVSRFTNQEIFKDLPAVLKQIVESCSPFTPPSLEGRGQGG